MEDKTIPMSRAQRSAETKERIYKAGRDLMRQYGFDGVTIKMITEAADVSIGTFYHFFQSKEDLLSRVSERANSLFSLPENLDYRQADCIGEITGFYKDFCEYMEEKGRDYAAEFMLGVRGNKTLFLHNRNYRIYMKTILNGFQAAGKIRSDCDIEKVEELLLVILTGVMYQWIADNDSGSLYETLSYAIQNAVRGVLVS